VAFVHLHILVAVEYVVNMLRKLCVSCCRRFVKLLVAFGLRSGCCLVAFWWLSGGLLFASCGFCAPANAIRRGIFYEIFGGICCFVCCGRDGQELVAVWLYTCCFQVALWLLSGCLLFAVARLFIRMLFAVAYFVEYVKEYVVGYLASRSWL
jgi:hypothetical protein